MCDVTGPWHHGLSRVGSFREAVGRGCDTGRAGRKAVQGASPGRTAAAARQQRAKQCRRAGRAGTQAPATATGSHGGRPGPPRQRRQRHRVHGEPSTAAHSDHTTTTTAGPALRTRRRAESRAASSAGSNTRRKPAPLAPAHVAATGDRSTESGKRRRGGAETARRCREPSTATAAEPGERRRSPTATKATDCWRLSRPNSLL